MRSQLLRAVCMGAWLMVAGNDATAQQAPPKLPQTHPYQQKLRQFMATVTEADVTDTVTAKIEVKPCDQDPEYLYRNYLYTLMSQPLVGTKRGSPAVNSAPVCFTLGMIEQPNGVYLPPAWPEAVVSFIQWNYPGNPYQNNRALKLRAFMTAAMNLMMFHDFAERNDQKVPPPIRPDWHGYNPVWWALPYPGFKDVLPADVQQAYEAGLKMVGERMLAWGIRGETCENDYTAPVGLLYIAKAINDPAFTKKVEEYARPLYTDLRYFHPAGYWDERGGIDTGFAGNANWFAAWTALLTDWPFVTDALARVYRLRGHLILPEPDGTFTGPSHFNSRLGSAATNDQWAWDGARDAAAAMVTDEAAQCLKTPSAEQLQNAPGARAQAFAFHLQENGRDDKGHYWTKEELQALKQMAMPWTMRMWLSYNFPASVNPGYELYRKGTWAHRQELEKANSPLLKSPFLRGESFVRAFEKDFLVVRQPGFAAILHTGPVGVQTPDDKKAQFAGPMGLGGGQLSAFWTPPTGSVLLSLRAGMFFGKSFEVLEAWRTWPSHAVSGVTVGKKVFTSARNARPEVTMEVKDHTATVTVGGPLVVMVVAEGPGNPNEGIDKNPMYDGALDGKITYARTFKTDDKGVSVETTVTGDGKDNVAELYEVLPVYLGRPGPQAKVAPTTIAFQVGGAPWSPATEQYSEKVTAVKLTRADGAVVVKFEKPGRAKLSPGEWKDEWLNVGATCRNVMIDLLANGDQPTVLKGTRKLGYRIEAAGK